MDNAMVSRIQGFTLDARHLLETEASGQLEGLYGWMPDGAFAAPSGYPAIGSLEEARQTREALERYVEEEKEAGVEAGVARKKLVRETAFTWLNRFVALKMMEERGLLKMTVSRLHESKAYVYWLADGLDPEADKLDRAGDLPLNTMGEGPRQVAYRRFLLWQCANLSKDVPVLFDPNDLPSRLFPRPVVIRDLVQEMTVPEMAEAWTEENEEMIGWVYQAFVSEELQAAFASARDQGKKFEPEDIPAVTQLFTMRWVVRFLVENTLGRYWMEMHPGSRLKEKLGYWVPSVSSKAVPLKPASAIRFLDPACGSMHFGLVAFNLFVEMYEEEFEKAGQPGWPEKASVEALSDIPGSIVAKNIYGIDLDLRAVQLSALTLFLRARTLNPECRFTDKNLVCANVERITGGRLEDFIRETKFSHPIYERIIRTLVSKLKDSDNLGSLLRLEQELESLIREERAKARSYGQRRFGLPGIPEELFDSEASLDSFFETLDKEVQRLLDDFVRKSRVSGKDPEHFALEAAKGLRLLKVMRRRYDIVTTNPPYLSNRKMNKRLAELMAENYPEGKTDLYAAFILRCEELLDVSGLMGMLTMHSFMFISSYEGLRSKLQNSSGVEVMAHYGGGLFAVGNPGTLQTTAFVLRREPDETARREREGVFFRLVREKDADSKRRMFEEALEAYRSTGSHSKVFKASQNDFEPIPGKPWVYWLPNNVKECFCRYVFLKESADPKQGLATTNNTRYLRKRWEIPQTKIGLSLFSRQEAERSGKRWFPYMKGGTPIPWYGNQEHIVNWSNDGKEIKEEIVLRYPYLKGKWEWVAKNVDYYFRRGVTWSLISSQGFAARLSPGGFIFDVAGMTCFPTEEALPLILAVLNSRVAQFLLSALNPTINFQVGDIERLPVPDKKSETIDALVAECIELARQDSRESETTWEFVQPLESLEVLSARKALLAEKEAAIDAEVSRLYGLTEEDLAAIDLELSGGQNEAAPETEDDAKPEEEETGPTLMTEQEWARRWVSYAAGIVLGRFEVGVEGGLGCGRFSPDIAERLKKLAAVDGILVNDPGHPLDLSRRTLEALETMLGTTEARRRIQAAFGEGNPQELLEAWFDRFSGTPDSSFWKFHFQMYRKRPVYWPLQSPRKLFTVWAFHERFTRDTLFQVRNALVEPRIRLAESRIKDLTPKAEKEKTARLERDRALDLLDDLKKFSEALRLVAENGYTPAIDDGVLLNAAPLHSMLPSWPETAKAWKELEKGEYDWARQAMAYRPERVKEKCAHNRSLAIAHGLESLCPPEESTQQPESGRRRGRKPREA